MSMARTKRQQLPTRMRNFRQWKKAFSLKYRWEFERLGEMFRRSAGVVPRGIEWRGIEWRSLPHFPNEVIAAQARAADMVVIGRDSLPGDVYRTYDPGVIILACGCPVLILPASLAWSDRLEEYGLGLDWGMLTNADLTAVRPIVLLVKHCSTPPSTSMVEFPEQS